MKPPRIFLALFLLSASPLLLAASEADCRRLLDANLPDMRITSAMVQARNSFAPPGADSAMRHPAFCRVAGVTEPAHSYCVGAHLWYSQAMLADEEAWIPPSRLSAYGARADRRPGGPGQFS